MNPLLMLAVVLLASLVLTGLTLRYAIWHQMLDLPNERSSHTIATPRGGGLAIVLATIGALLVFRLQGLIAPSLFVAWGGAGAAVATMGFLDDHRPISPAIRLAVHLAAAIWLLAFVGGAPPLQMLAAIEQSWLWPGLFVVGIIWLVNLTNFMDGIDGLAAVEVVTACGGGAAVMASMGAPVAATLPPLALAAAALGFLGWNWPPARIFLGDVGSGFMGLLLAGFALHAAWVEPRLFWAWLILVAVFVADATVTLLRRIARGERFYQAHRSHAYQRLAQRVGRHLPVTIGVAAVNVAWLLPLAWLLGHARLGVLTGMLLAYVPLVCLSWILGAGLPEPATSQGRRTAAPGR